MSDDSIQEFLEWHNYGDHKRVSDCHCVRCSVYFEEFYESYLAGDTVTDYQMANRIRERYVWIFEIDDGRILLEQRGVDTRTLDIPYTPDVMRLIQSLGYCEA